MNNTGVAPSPGARIRHFYTTGSRNGLEGLGSGGFTYENIKKQSRIIKKAFATLQTRQNCRKVKSLDKYACESHIFDKKFDVRAWRRPWNGSRHPETAKNMEIDGLASSGLVAQKLKIQKIGH